MPSELSRKELLDKIEKDASAYEENWKGCSRSVMRALCENMDLGNDETIIASAVLAGGGGLTMDTCGALSAGMMAIALAMGSKGATPKDPNDQEAFFRTLAAGNLFYISFLEEFGSSLCRHIQTRNLGKYYNIADPQQYKQAVAAGVYGKAAGIVGRATRLAAEFIIEQRENDWEEAQKASIYIKE